MFPSLVLDALDESGQLVPLFLIVCLFLLLLTLELYNEAKKLYTWRKMADPN